MEPLLLLVLAETIVDESIAFTQYHIGSVRLCQNAVHVCCAYWQRLVMEDKQQDYNHWYRDS
jgi:hypothetical protein